MKHLLDRLGDYAEVRMPVSTVVALALSTIAGCVILAFLWGIR